MNTFVKNILALILFFVVAFYFWTPLSALYVRVYNQYFPCKNPIAYSIGTFDTRFGISKEDFLDAMSSAEAIWEKPIKKDLFTYSSEGQLKVNLIYDIRQESTSQLQNIGTIVDNNKASYDAMVAQYKSMSAAYEVKKSSFQSRLSAFETRKAEYQAEVVAVNRKGGADKATFNRLNTEKQYLDNETSALNQLQQSLNTDVDELNTLRASVNQLAAMLNIDVKTYNSIGSSVGGEFDEGVYRSNSKGQEINIDQFENHAKLVRVLAHELGHALGLDHVDDSKAIMYRFNNGINEKLTEADLVELKALCEIK